MTQPLRSLVLAGLILLLPATASSQIIPAWETTLSQTATREVFHHGVRPTPGAGALILTSADVTGDGLPDRGFVYRVSENGDQDWETLFLMPVMLAPQLNGAPDSTVLVDVDTAGRSLFAFQSGLVVSVIRIDVDGTIDWQTSVARTDPLDAFYLADVALSPSGDVVVVGFGGVQGAWTSQFVNLGVDGVETWRHEVNGGGAQVAISSTGTVFAANQSGSATIEVQRLSSTGTAVWSVQRPSVSITDPVLSTIEGESVVLEHYASIVPVQREASLIDGAGSLLWSVTLPASSGRRICGAYTSASGVRIIARSSNEQHSVRAAAGANLQSTPSPSDLDLTWDAAVDERGNVSLAGAVIDPVTGQHLPAIEAFDANGTRLGITVFDESTPPATSPMHIAFDTRGNALLGVAVENSSGALGTAFTAKAILSGLPGIVFCTPAAPNSTGVDGMLDLAGSPEVARNNLALFAYGLPPQAFAMVIASQTPAFVPGAGGGVGTLCLGGGIGRYSRLDQIRRVTREGTTSFQLELTEMATPLGFQPATVGQVWLFQAWYRDVAAGMATSNFTNGVLAGLR